MQKTMIPKRACAEDEVQEKLRTKKFVHSGTVSGRIRASCTALCSRGRLQGTCDSLWYVRRFHVGFILTDAHWQSDERGDIPEAIFVNVSSHKSLQSKAG